MTTQVSNQSSKAVPGISLSRNPGEFPVSEDPLLIQEDYNSPFRVQELETSDLKQESKNCIHSLLKGMNGLKAKSRLIAESRTQTRLSNYDPAAHTKVIDVRPIKSPRMEHTEPIQAGTGDFQEEVKSFKESKNNKSKGKPKDPINLPRYGRGKDPGPEIMGTFMEKRDGARPKIVDNQKKAFELKYEQYLAKKKTIPEPQVLSSKAVFVESEIIQMLRQCFRELEQEQQSGLVPKRSIMQFFHNNPSISRLFGLESFTTPENFLERTEDCLGNIGFGDALEQDEFLEFYQVSKNNKAPSVSLTSESASVNVSFTRRRGRNVSKLSPELLSHIKWVYEDLNADSNPAIEREAFVMRLKADIEIQANWDSPALDLMDGGKLSLGKLIEKIEDDEEDLKLISWSEVLACFFVDEDKEPEEDLERIDVEKEDIKLLHDVFVSLGIDEDAVSTQAFIRKVMEDPSCSELRSKVVRTPRGLSKYPEETLDRLLIRVGQSNTEILSWGDFLGYLTTRGVPRPSLDENYASDPEIYASVVSIHAREPSLPRSLSTDPKLVSTPLGERYAITVPKPFAFTTRERSKQKPIMQIKLEAMLDEKERKEMEPCKVRIRAREVPAEVIIPQYDRIMRQLEERREQVHRASIEITKRNEKPFSFYLRDKEKQRPVPEPQEPYVFKANPVPWESTVPLLERMNTEGAEARKERIEERARTLFAESKLPPRMEMYAQSTSQAKFLPKSRPKSVSFRAKPVPDFSTLQASFQRELDSRKQGFQSTVPEPFHFNESRKTSKYREYMDAPDALQQWTGPKQTDLQKVFRRPTKEPSSTEKHKGLVELRKREQQEKEAKELLKAQENAARLERQERMRPIVQQSEVLTDNRKILSERREQAVREWKRQSRELDQKYKMETAEMMERVYARPLMVEQVTQDARRKAGKLRALLEARGAQSEEGVDSDLPFSEEDQGVEQYLDDRRMR